MRKGFLLVLAFSLFAHPLAIPTSADASSFHSDHSESCLLHQGESSYYGENFEKEKLNEFAANGKRFDPNAMTAASPTLAFGTKVKVTDRETGRSIIVTITDRGPARWTGRVLDLSFGAAKKLGMVQRGVASVTIEQTSGPCSGVTDGAVVGASL